MITGDNPLTACHVAKELQFTRKPLLVLTAPTEGMWKNKSKYSCLWLNLESDDWKWESVNKDTYLPIQPAHTRNLTREYDLCVTGEVKNEDLYIIHKIYSLFFFRVWHILVHYQFLISMQ